MSGGWQRGLQVALAAVAGFVNAIGFFMLGGVFVAFMSGNSTTIGMATTSSVADPASLVAELAGCFVAGVALGMRAGGRMRRRRPAGVMLLLAGMLAGAAGLAGGGFVLPGGLLLAAAMGAENTVFHRPGHPAVGLTYMTGTLVRVGQHVAGALNGEGWAAMVPDALLWLGMVGGAAGGAAAFRLAGPDGLWAGAGAVLVLAGLARWAAAGASPAAGTG